jgi:hypothetical protein
MRLLDVFLVCLGACMLLAGGAEGQSESVECQVNFRGACKDQIALLNDASKPDATPPISHAIIVDMPSLERSLAGWVGMSALGALLVSSVGALPVLLKNHVRVCVCMCICVYMCVYVCVCMCVVMLPVLQKIHARGRERECVCVCISVCIYVHIHWYAG